MAYYELGKVIRMRRNAIGCGRESFDADGPAGMTIYRIEKGKSNGTESTYRKLTKSMGVEESTRQGILKTNHMDILHLVNDIAKVLREKNDEKAEQMLLDIEKSIDTDIPRNKQYIEWTKAKLDYRNNRITTEKYEEIIRRTLEYTIPGAEKTIFAEWPFHEQEWQILVTLSNSLRAQKRYQEQKLLLEEMRTVLDTGYMNTEWSLQYRIIILLCTADLLGNEGFHREAIHKDREVISLCEEHREFTYITNAYYDIHWNFWELKKQETLSAQEESESKQCLLKAYYVSEAYGLGKELYRIRLQERYPNELL